MRGGSISTLLVVVLTLLYVSDGDEAAKVEDASLGRLPAVGWGGWHTQGDVSSRILRENPCFYVPMLLLWSILTFGRHCFAPTPIHPQLSPAELANEHLLEVTCLLPSGCGPSSSIPCMGALTRHISLDPESPHVLSVIGAMAVMLSDLEFVFRLTCHD